MRKITLPCLFILLACCCQQVLSQTNEDLSWGARLGVLYGGPIPSTALDPDSSSGKPGLGPSFALSARYELSPKWSLTAEVGYAYKGVAYGQLIRQDTNVTLELLPGMVDTVPSFYFADVAGIMKLHYLEIPLMVEFHPKSWMSIKAGFNSALLLGGQDAGTAEIQIGDGGIFQDTTITYENIDGINRFDGGIVVGGAVELPSGWWIEVRGYRSLRNLYKPGYLASQGVREAQLYHTQGYLGVGYRF